MRNHYFYDSSKYYKLMKIFFSHKNILSKSVNYSELINNKSDKKYNIFMIKKTNKNDCTNFYFP